MSRYVSTIESAISATSSSVETAKLRLRLAIYHARRGDFDQATAIVQEIRKRQGQSPIAELTILANLAEAAVFSYSTSSPLALEKLRRAYALASVFSPDELLPLCAAWMAHKMMAEARWLEVAGYAKQAIQASASIDHSTNARAMLIVATGHHLATGYEVARPWYELTRRHALADGDEVMIGSIIYNSAAYSIHSVRFRGMLGPVEASELKHCRLQIESCLNYDALSTSSSERWDAPTMKAQLLVAADDYTNAERIFRTWLPKIPSGTAERFIPPFEADLSKCLLAMGALAEARHYADAALSKVELVAAADDRAMMAHRLAEVYSGLGEAALVERLRDESSRSRGLALQQYARFSADLLEQVGAAPA